MQATRAFHFDSGSALGPAIGGNVLAAASEVNCWRWISRSSAPLQPPNLHDANWHNDWDHRHVHFDHGRFFVFVDGFWCGLDDGFFPWDYLPYYPDDYYPYDYDTNTDPYDYNGSTYDLGSGDSATVQAVQTRLFNLGYYAGSIDGVFGPTTRDAVAKYQIANHLTVTGSLSPDTIQSLGLVQATAS
jgi:hypothetical protein